MSSTTKLLAQQDAGKAAAFSTSELAAIKIAPKIAKSSSQCTKTASIGTSVSDEKTPPISLENKSSPNGKSQEKRTVTAIHTPTSKSKKYSHDAIVLHVGQDSADCTPIATLKPTVSATPDLCYAGTEDIFPTNVTKIAKTRMKTCSKKETKSYMKQKVDNNSVGLLVKRNTKATAKKFNNKPENVNGSIDIQVEVTNNSVEPIKKKKTKKPKTNEMVKNSKSNSWQKRETYGIQKKTIKNKKKVTTNVKEEAIEMDTEKDIDGNMKPGCKKKKRKVDIEKNDAEMLQGPKTKKKRKTDKENSAQDEGTTGKTKKGDINAEPIENSHDLNGGFQNKDEDSIALSAVLINKKPTAEALALQATVEKLQGRLTPTLYQANNANTVNTNGRNIESLHAILPKLVSSRPDKQTTEDEAQDKPHGITSDMANVVTNKVAKEAVNSGCKDNNKEPSIISPPNVPLNLSNLKESAKHGVIYKDKSVVFGSEPETCGNSDSSQQSTVLDLSNKGGKSISTDGSICLSMKDQSVDFSSNKGKSIQHNSRRTDLLIKPIAHVNDLDSKNSRKPMDESDSVVSEAVDLQTKNIKGAQTDGTGSNKKEEENATKPRNLSKAVKKERVESAIERLFQKRDNAFGSSGIKKQRVEKTIDMLLAKKKSVERTDNGPAVTENFHQKSDSTKESLQS